MSDHKKVSVIIPVYQVENYLERAVDSVLEQTLSEMEIILVDDGSEDTSPQICDRYAREYPDRIRVIHKENEGLGMARNTGVRAAVGEYIAFLDSDDTVEPEMYEELYERAVEENYDMVMCDVKIIYVEEDRSVVVSTYSSEEIDLSDYIANGNNITYSVNKLYSRRIWEENQYEKMLFEDIALIPSLITKYQHIGYVKNHFTITIGERIPYPPHLSAIWSIIVQAFRYFIDRSNPKYREEVVYNTAKQLYWNLTQSRVLFQADFIELLKEYKKISC
ncbi:MAG: glycosyltransferase family 2 protein [Clostridia bacterium]